MVSSSETSPMPKPDQGFDPRCSLDTRSRLAWFALSAGLLMAALWVNQSPGLWPSIASAALGFAGGIIMSMKVVR